MKSQRMTSIFGTIALAMAGLFSWDGSRAAAQGANPDAGNGAEVLTRGPIHEAYAQPGDYNPRLGAVISRRSPASIEEIPPDQRPEGDALWIPGYWQWDDDRGDFIWISGIWRLPPPNQSWVPGYWTEASEGWIWTPGFWMAAQVEEVEYLRQPPDSLELGPSSPPPSVNHLWAPGCWSWTTSRYAWRPGYWVEARPDWIWEPAHYIRTPRGCIYVDGYWDRPFERRGVIFAPVYFSSPVYSQPHYYYSPTIVIEVSILFSHLFVDLHHHHYSFGDYYGDEYRRRGCYPWFEYHDRHHGYDPIYVHERWSHHRDDSHWDDRIREDYRYRVENTDARPARLYRDQSAYEARAPENMRQSLNIAATLNEVSAKPNKHMRFEKIDDDRRKSFQGQGRELAKFRDERVNWESKRERKSDDHGKRSDSAEKGNASDKQSRDDDQGEVPAAAPGESSERRSRDSKQSESRDSRQSAEPDARKPRDSEFQKSVEQDQTPREQPKQAEEGKQKHSDSQKSAEQDQTPREQSKQADEGKQKHSDSRKSTEQDPAPGDQSKRAGEGRPDEKSSSRSRRSEDRASDQPEKVRIPKSPVVGKHSAEASNDGNPPARPDMPKPDPKVKSKSEETRGKTRTESGREAPRSDGGKEHGKEQEKDEEKDHGKDKPSR